MSRYGVMMDRIRAGDCILIDGATGTEAQRRGVPQLDNAWNGGGALSHPDIIRQVHLDYLESGAEMIISNSFATHLHALEAAGEGARFEDYNRRAVELAVEARSQSKTMMRWSVPVCPTGAGAVTCRLPVACVRRRRGSWRSWPRPAPMSCFSR